MERRGSPVAAFPAIAGEVTFKGSEVSFTGGNETRRAAFSNAGKADNYPFHIKSMNVVTICVDRHPLDHDLAIPRSLSIDRSGMKKCNVDKHCKECDETENIDFTHGTFLVFIDACPTVKTKSSELRFKKLGNMGTNSIYRVTLIGSIRRSAPVSSSVSRYKSP
jgi:hypothetical protein